MALEGNIWFSNGLTAATAAGYRKERCRITEVQGLNHEQNGYRGGLALGIDSEKSQRAVRLTSHEMQWLRWRAKFGDNYGMLCKQEIDVYFTPANTENGEDGSKREEIVGISYPAR
jgi:hypothetical protein